MFVLRVFPANKVKLDFLARRAKKVVKVPRVRLVISWHYPVKPNINMQILVAVLHIFVLRLVGRICLNISTFPLFAWPVGKQKLDVSHCLNTYCTKSGRV